MAQDVGTLSLVLEARTQEFKRALSDASKVVKITGADIQALEKMDLRKATAALKEIRNAAGQSGLTEIGKGLSGSERSIRQVTDVLGLVGSKTQIAGIQEFSGVIGGIGEIFEKIKPITEGMNKSIGNLVGGVGGLSAAFAGLKTALVPILAPLAAIMALIVSVFAVVGAVRKLMAANPELFGMETDKAKISKLSQAKTKLQNEVLGGGQAATKDIKEGNGFFAKTIGHSNQTLKMEDTFDKTLAKFQALKKEGYKLPENIDSLVTEIEDLNKSLGQVGQDTGNGGVLSNLWQETKAQFGEFLTSLKLGAETLTGDMEGDTAKQLGLAKHGHVSSDEMALITSAVERDVKEYNAYVNRARDSWEAINDSGLNKAIDETAQITAAVWKDQAAYNEKISLVQAHWNLLTEQATNILNGANQDPLAQSRNALNTFEQSQKNNPRDMYEVGGRLVKTAAEHGAQKFIGAIEIFTNAVSDQAPRLSETFNAAMQGFQNGGGIWGAIIAVIAQILTYTKSFSAIMKEAEYAIQPLVEIVNAIFEPIVAIFTSFQKLGQATSRMILPIFKLIGNIAQALDVVAPIINAIVDKLVEWFNDFIEWLANFVETFHSNWGDDIRKYKISLDDLTAPTEAAAEAMRAFTGALNAPDGFKLAYKRLQAMDPSEVDAGQDMFGSAATSTIGALLSTLAMATLQSGIDKAYAHLENAGFQGPQQGSGFSSGMDYFGRSSLTEAPATVIIQNAYIQNPSNLEDIVNSLVKTAQKTADAASGAAPSGVNGIQSTHSHTAIGNVALWKK